MSFCRFFFFGAGCGGKRVVFQNVPVFISTEYKEEKRARAALPNAKGNAKVKNSGRVGGGVQVKHFFEVLQKGRWIELPRAGHGHVATVQRQLFVVLVQHLFKCGARARELKQDVVGHMCKDARFEIVETAK